MSSYRKSELFRAVLHPAMSVSVSVTSALAVVFLLGRLFGLPGIRPVTVIVVALAPLVEALVGNLLYAERAGVGNRIRELIIYLLLVYLLFSLLRPGSLTQRFSPSGIQLLPCLVAGLAWLLAFAIHARLRGRESLLKAFHGKRGEELRHALVDRQHDMALTVRELRQVRTLVGTVFVLVAVPAVVVSAGWIGDSSLPVSSPGFILACVSGLVTAVAIGALNVYMDEYAANGIGLAVQFRFQRRRLVVGSVLAVAAASAAFVLSRNESLLPLESIAAFFRWFGGLFDRDRPPPEPQPLPQRPAQPLYYDLLRDMLGDVEPRVPPLWARILAQLLRRLAVSIGFAAVALAIFGPLFSPAFRAGLKRLRPFNALKDSARRLRRQAVILWRWLRAWAGKAFSGKSGIRDASESTAVSASTWAGPGTWRPSLHKRRQMDRVVAVFASVARWGENHGIRYRTCDGASDYLERISELYPEHYAETRACARLFWEARYSRRTLSMGEMREYVRSARTITEAG